MAVFWNSLFPPQVALFSDVVVMTLLHIGYYMILKIDALQVLPYNSIEFISSCYTNSCMWDKIISVSSLNNKLVSLLQWFSSCMVGVSGSS